MDDLTWRFVPGTKGRYIVSNYGDMQKIKSDGTVEYRCGSLKNNGYRMHNLAVNGVHDQQQIGVWMLRAFVGPRPDGMQCCHADDDQMNNHLSNLRWDTFAANIKDRTANGGDLVGEKHANAKLTEDMIRTIRQLRNQLGWSLQAIADQFRLSISNVSLIANYKSWSHV